MDECCSALHLCGLFYNSNLNYQTADSQKARRPLHKLFVQRLSTSSVRPTLSFPFLHTQHLSLFLTPTSFLSMSYVIRTLLSRASGTLEGGLWANNLRLVMIGSCKSPPHQQQQQQNSNLPNSGTNTPFYPSGPLDVR